MRHGGPPPAAPHLLKGIDMKRVTSHLVAALAMSALAAACGGGASGGVSSDEAFVSVPRNSDPSRQAARQDTNSQQNAQDEEEFYLVMNRKELGNKWFLSAYLQQYFPGAVGYGPV